MRISINMNPATKIAYRKVLVHGPFYEVSPKRLDGIHRARTEGLVFDGEFIDKFLRPFYNL